MKIADCHAHIFPDKLADKAVKSIGNFYDSNMEQKGTAEDLIKCSDEIGITTLLVSSSATKPEQVEHINDFIHQECEKFEKFIGLGTLHPDFANIDDEIDKILKYNLKGIKLHPDFQSFNIDDEKAIDMYKKISDANLPILFHTGDKRYDASSPERLANAVKKVPNLKCVAAHFGGYNHWYDVTDYLKNLDNVMFDTSSTLFALNPLKAINMINELGEDKFLFGSDYPMWNPKHELQLFMNLNLTDLQREKILWDNFQRIFA